MSRPAWFVARLSLLVLILASPARAGVCNMYNSTMPPYITLVGTAGGVADPFGQFSITVRDYASNLLPNFAVTIDFSANTDLRIASAQPFAGVQAHCTQHLVAATTDWRGVVTFRIVGGSRPGPGVKNVTAKLYGETCYLGMLRVSAIDLDGAGGVGANDLSLWVSDFLTGQPYCRSDFDASGSLGAADLSRWITAFLAAGSTSSANPVCP